MKRTAIFTALAALAILPVACAKKPATTASSDEPKAVAVTVAEAKNTALRRTVPVTGTLYPYEDVTLAPKVGGRVIRVHRDVGDRVLPGDPLLELDDAEYQLAVAQARAAFDAELRKLKLTALPAGDTDIEQIVAKVDAVVEARANVTFAEADWKREEKLSGVVGAAQALDVAVNRLAVAKARLQLAETDARVTLANARRLKAALDDAERKLSDTKLFAPIPPEWALWLSARAVGPHVLPQLPALPPCCAAWLKELSVTPLPLNFAVAQKMVSVGEMVQSMPITNCYRLVIDNVLKFGVAVPEKHFPEVTGGQLVELRIEAYPGQVFTGKVARISPTIDQQNRTFGVVVAVLNLDGRLKAGGFATAEIVTRTENVVTIPPEALVQFAGVSKVFVAEGDKARAVEVTVGARDKDWVEVGGLPAGAKVITSGQSQLVDGSVIRVRWD
jgi:multidrug efflux pump subunit AcrA (membrane-fusion protein)